MPIQPSRQNVTTRHNCSRVPQITILLETMYIDSSDEERQQSGDEADNATEQLQELCLRTESLEDHLREAVDSTPNREDGLRAAVEAAATGANEYTDERLHRFDQAVAECLEHRDKQWRPGFSTPAVFVPTTVHLRLMLLSHLCTPLHLNLLSKWSSPGLMNLGIPKTSLTLLSTVKIFGPSGLCMILSSLAHLTQS